MRSIFYSCLIIFLLNITTVSQDITTTLSGNTSNQGFTILNAQGDTLFRTTGEGNTGIGTNNPLGLFDVRGTSGVGRGIYLLSEGVDDLDGVGGEINLKAGFTINGDPSMIQMKGGQPGQNGGNLNLLSGLGGINGGDINVNGGAGSVYAGDINIIAGEGGQYGGDVLIQSGGADVFGGKIKMNARSGPNLSGQIEIVTEAGPSPNGHISLISGLGNIYLTANSGTGYPGSDIMLTPGNGDTNGLVKIIGSGTYTGTWTQASDERFKTDIKPIKNATEKILQMKGVSYYLRKDEFPEKNFDSDLHIGLIAQNVEQVIPEVVRTDSDGYKSIAYQNLVPVLIEAIKEQQASIELLKEEITKLKSESQNQMVKFSSIEK